MIKRIKSLRQITIFLVSLLLSYLILAVGLYIVLQFLTFTQGQQLIRKYLHKNERMVREQIFSSGFMKAQQCLTINDGEDKSACEVLVGRHIADSIIEEELNGGYGSTADDLFFVKKVGESYFKLNWTGKLVNITHQVNIYSLRWSFAQPFFFLFRQCKYFNLYDVSVWSCELYTPINLSNGESGYIVRLVSLTEEMWLSTFFIIPLLLLMHILSNPVSSILAIKDGWTFAYVMLFLSITPVIIAIFITYIYKRKNSSHKIRK